MVGQSASRGGGGRGSRPGVHERDWSTMTVGLTDIEAARECEKGDFPPYGMGCLIVGLLGAESRRYLKLLDLLVASPPLGSLLYSFLSLIESNIVRKHAADAPLLHVRRDHDESHQPDCGRQGRSPDLVPRYVASYDPSIR